MPPSTPNLLLVHGLGESARAFDPVHGLLPGAPLALDLPGFGGRADEPARASIEAMAASIRPEVDAAAGDGPAVLVGHSMGGCIGVALAEAGAPLAGVIAVGAPLTVEGRATAGRGGEALVRHPLLGPIAWRAASRRSLRRGLRTAFAPGFPVPDAFVDDLATCSWRAFTGSTAAIDAWLSEGSLAARLARLSIPAGYVMGGLDARITPAARRAFVEAAPVPIRVIDGVGHTPMWEAPGAFASALLGLLSTLRLH